MKKQGLKFFQNLFVKIKVGKREVISPKRFYAWNFKRPKLNSSLLKLMSSEKWKKPEIIMYQLGKNCDEKNGISR